MRQTLGEIAGLERSGAQITFPVFIVKTKFGFHEIRAGSPLNEKDEEDTKRRRLYQGMLQANAAVIVVYKWRLFRWLFGAQVVRTASNT